MSMNSLVRNRNLQFDIHADILKMPNLHNFKIENTEVNGINLSYLNYLKTFSHNWALTGKVGLGKVI